MDSTSKQRIVRLATKTLTVAVLVPVLYVTTGVSVAFLDAAGWLPLAALPILKPAYGPLEWYLETDRPGSAAIMAVVDSAKDVGYRISD